MSEIHILKYIYFINNSGSDKFKWVLSVSSNFLKNETGSCNTHVIQRKMVRVQNTNNRF